MTVSLAKLPLPNGGVEQLNKVEYKSLHAQRQGGCAFDITRLAIVGKICDSYPVV